MTTRIETIMPNQPTYKGEMGIEYGMHNGWTIEVTNKDPDYFTNDYPSLIKTGPSSLIAQQNSYASSTYSITGGPVYPDVGTATWYEGATYITAELNGVVYKIKWNTSVTTPTQVKNIIDAAGYVTA